MTRIDYHFVDGSFERVPFNKLTKRVARELLKLERREERTLEKICRFLHGDGYVEGESEIKTREINFSDPVADALDTLLQDKALRCAVSRLNATQRQRIWWFAQGYTSAEIAQFEGVSKVAVHKSIKLAKKKIKKFLEMG